MKSVRVIAALNLATVALVAVTLVGCADYSVQPTSGLLTSLVDPADRGKSAPRGVVARLRSSSVILDGAITSLEVGAVKGGSAASILGVGASTPYWRVAVAVEVRAANARTGAISRTVSARDTIYAVELGEGGVKYTTPGAGRSARMSPSIDEVQEMAARRAIRKAVRRLRTPRLIKPDHMARSLPGTHRKGAASKEKTGAASTPPTGTAPATASAIPWLSHMQAFGLAR
jgi:hypothetical protein